MLPPWSSPPGSAEAGTLPAVANRKKTAKKRKQTHPLPKVGTPKDEAYVLRRSREDLDNFGVNRDRKGPSTAIIVMLIAVLLALGVVGMIALT